MFDAHTEPRPDPVDAPPPALPTASSLADPPARFYSPDPEHPGRLLPGDELSSAADLTVAAMHGAFRAFVQDPQYTCVGAKSAINNSSYRLGVYDELGSADATAALARDLTSFLAQQGSIDARFATFVAVFQRPQSTDEEGFERALWAQLQRLHDADDTGWDPTVSANPDDPHFSFSFAGTAFFIVGLHPGSARLSRRFPWPALVFNPHAQFEALREAGKYERMRQVIRDKERALQGDINPVLEDFGGDSEARQYSGRHVETDWHPPFCPHFHATAAMPTESPAPIALDGLRPRPGQRYRIPPHSGVAFHIDRGQTLRIVDPEGHQVCDLYSVARDDLQEQLSSGRSIDYADTLYLTTGHALYSSAERPMWTIGRDDVGRHDLVLTPCSPTMYRKLRGDDGTHPSCLENLRVPMSALGADCTRIGSTFNIFMDVRFDPTTGKMAIATPPGEPGATIELRAELDMIVGLTACSSEVTNGGSLKPIDFEIVAESPPRARPTS